VKRVIFFIISCVLTINYAYAKSECDEILEQVNPKKKLRELFIVVDQTTPFPEEVRKNALRNIYSTIQGNTAISLFTFSEYTKEKYVSFVDHYYIPGQISAEKRADMGQKLLKKFDQCLEVQTYGMKQKLAHDIYKQLSEENSSAKNSEILFSLQEISKQAVKISNAKEKIVFVLSDMLENSSYTTFYGKALTNLDIEKQIGIVKQNHLLGDFDHAKIFVYGAGIVDKENRRTGEDLRQLKRFWEAYFQASSGQLKVFGLDGIYQANEYL
jgi:hypothetical protein